MAHHRSLLAIALLAAILHAVAITRTLLPAQDGLKLIRFAKQFHTQPWSDVIRGADVHPLYPALVAMIEPPVSSLVGEGPDAWRLAAQLVAALSAIGVLVPIYFLTEALFDRRIAFIAAGVLALLPRVAEAGHETLADSLGLFATFMALWLAARAFQTGNRGLAIVSGLFAGMGYLARPEVILVPAAIVLTWLVARVWSRGQVLPGGWVAALLMLVGPVLAVGGYAAIKGEMSEKLSIRQAAGLGPQYILKRAVPQQVPRGLDDPRWDFSPKEETDRVAIRGTRQALKRILGRWWEELAWFFAVMTVWGAARQSSLRSMISEDREGNGDRRTKSEERMPQRPVGYRSPSLRSPQSVLRNRSLHGLSTDDQTRAPRVDGLILGLFAGIYALALLRHSTVLGYLSWRHVLPLVVASIPWAAGGTYICCRRIAELLRLGPRATSIGRLGAMAFAMILSLGTQLNPHHLNHLSRWGHWAAGRWLSTHAAPGEEVLDTRGWARFVSGLPGYDYWHVRQALTDSHLSYILVGLDELKASSPRAETLRSLLAYAATPLAEFPAAPGDSMPAVLIYRFRRPASWEGFAR